MGESTGGQAAQWNLALKAFMLKLFDWDKKHQQNSFLIYATFDYFELLWALLCAPKELASRW